MPCLDSLVFAVHTLLLSWILYFRGSSLVFTHMVGVSGSDSGLAQAMVLLLPGEILGSGSVVPVLKVGLSELLHADFRLHGFFLRGSSVCTVVWDGCSSPFFSGGFGSLFC